MNKMQKFTQLLRSKHQLMKCIFITLIFQIIISIITIKIDSKIQLFENYSWISVILIIALFIIIFTINIKSLSFITKQILFVLFSIIIGLLLSNIIHIIKDKQIIEGAVISTLINVIAMFLFGLLIVYYNYDLSWLGIYLFMGILCLITISFISIFTKQSTSSNYTS